MSEEDVGYGTEEESKGRRGRPKGDPLVLFRENGRIKAWNPRIEARVNTPGRIGVSVRVYDGLSADWVTWKSKTTRDGDYNTANRSPFRKATEEGRVLVPVLDGFFGEASGDLRPLFERLEMLFSGTVRHAPVPLTLTGSYWVRFFAALFVREAGADGINRMNRQPVSGKVWASVNLLPPQGVGYNYTEEPWYSVVNSVRPPLFCVRVRGSEYVEKGMPESGWCEEWPPERLAAAVLASLEAVDGANSCTEAAGVEEETKEAPKSVAQSPAAAPEALPASEDTGETAPPENPIPDASAEVKAEQPPARKTWGEFLDVPVSVKGLTTSKDLGMPTRLRRVFEMVTDHEVTRRLTAQCRALADKKDRNAFKRDNMHVFYPSALFADRFKGSVKSNIAGFTGLACLDFDGMETAGKAEEARDDLFMQFREVLFSAVSASGLGVYAVVALDFDGTEDGYRTALDAAFQMFEAKGYMPDTGCADPTRARYVAADADAMCRPDAYEVVPVSASGEGYVVLPATMLRDCWTNAGRRKKGAGKEYLKEALERVATAPDGSKDTAMTSVMGTAARLIRNYGLDADWVYSAIRKAGREYGYDEKKTEDKIRRLGVRNEKTGDHNAG